MCYFRKSQPEFPIVRERVVCKCVCLVFGLAFRIIYQLTVDQLTADSRAVMAQANAPIFTLRRLQHTSNSNEKRR